MSENKMGKIDVDYKCSICNLPVIVKSKEGSEPEIIRSCDHSNAIVIAWLSGTLVRTNSNSMGSM